MLQFEEKLVCVFSLGHTPLLFIHSICTQVTSLHIIYINTLPQDGRKISVMPILTHIDSFLLGPKPFVKQSANWLQDFTYSNFKTPLSILSLMKEPINLYMLSAVKLNWIVCNVYCSHIVAVKSHSLIP
jgi:hypothetical protein